MALQSDLSRFFGDTYTGGEVGGRGTWAPFLDIYEEGDGFRISVDLPGLTADDVEVTLDQNLLTIRGERKTKNELKEENFHRIERRYGSFERTISLPAQLDAEGIQADFSNGVLEVHVPKAEQAKPRKIKIGETRQIEA
jgi:HSP20 family protein